MARKYTIVAAGEPHRLDLEAFAGEDIEISVKHLRGGQRLVLAVPPLEGQPKLARIKGTTSLVAEAGFLAQLTGGAARPFYVWQMPGKRVLAYGDLTITAAEQPEDPVVLAPVVAEVTGELPIDGTAEGTVTDPLPAELQGEGVLPVVGAGRIETSEITSITAAGSIPVTGSGQASAAVTGSASGELPIDGTGQANVPTAATASGTAPLTGSATSRAIVRAMAQAALGIGGTATAVQGTPPVQTSRATLGMNLANIEDWMTAYPLLDMVKFSRFVPSGSVGPDGWPISGTTDVTWADQTTAMGRIGVPLTVTWDGPATATGIYASTLTGTGNTRTLTFAEGINGIRMSGAFTNLRVIRADQVSLVNAGEVFNPDYLAKIDTLGFHRGMDWTRTNEIDGWVPIGTWANRAHPDDITFNTFGSKGAPWELQIALANKTRISPWFCLPHTADDNYVDQFAALVRDNLDPTIRFYVERGNELWNAYFGQWYDDLAAGRALWGPEAPGRGDFEVVLNYHAMETTRFLNRIHAVMGGRSRVIGVLGCQTGAYAAEQMMNAPLWTTKPAGGWPKDVADTVAFTSYIGHGLYNDAAAVSAINAQYPATSNQVIRDWLLNPTETAGDAVTWAGLITDACDVVKAEGLRPILYEGGLHSQQGGVSASSTLGQAILQFQRSSDWADVINYQLGVWEAVGEGPFVQYVDVARWGYPYNDSGNWSAWENLTQANLPFTQALIDWAESTPVWWTEPALVPSHTARASGGLTPTGSATATARARGTAAGTVPLTGSTAAVTPQRMTASGGPSLTGSSIAGARARATATGSVGLTGSATGNVQTVRNWTPADLVGTEYWAQTRDETRFATTSGAQPYMDPNIGTVRASMSNVANQPTRGAVLVNGVPALSFDGSNDTLIAPTGNNLGNAPSGSLMVASVGRIGTGNAGLWRGVMTAQNGNWALDGLSGVRFSVFGPSGGATASAGSASTTLPQIRVGILSGLDVRAYFNGELGGTSGTLTDLPNNTDGEFRIASRITSGPTTQYSPADLLEIYIGPAPSTADRQRLEGYWAHEYDLTDRLAANHPYKTARPTVAVQSNEPTSFTFTPAATINENSTPGTSAGSIN